MTGGGSVPCFLGFRTWVEDTYGFPSQQWIDAWQEDNKTCLLPDGHEGPHVWTPDTTIRVCRPSPGPGHGERREVRPRSE